MKDILDALCSVKSRKDAEQFLEEMLTGSEYDAVKKRFNILSLLADGEVQAKIGERLSASLCNVTRGSKILKDENSFARRFFENQQTSVLMPDEKGFFGEFGGRFVDEKLDAELQLITDKFLELINNQAFNDEYNNLLKNYVGRPSPVYFARNLSKKYGCKIFLKREDLNHTGAHKITHCLGECLLAKYLGKKKVIAETGAGQHGLALATAAALFGLECDIYMGEVDVKKEAPNVHKMKLLGANVICVKDGQRTLKEAVDAAFQAYAKEYKTAMYAIGSVVGPHPFPMIVGYFQSVVGREAKYQMLDLNGALPNYVVACVGGGSNAMGIFSGFLNDIDKVQIIGVEPLGRGAGAGENAASITYGKPMQAHGFSSIFLQDKNKNMAEAYSIASGLDYPGVGPQHAFLNSMGAVKYETATDKEALDAFYELSRMEGIIPALESSHALAYALKLAKKCKSDESILVNISGRGDKDVEFVLSLQK